MQRVLIVDDHVLFAEAAAVALRRTGIEVDVVHLASAALDAVRSDECDVVLMDVSLPDGSGLAAGAEIVRTRAGTKVVAITALNDPDGPSRAVRAGFHGYLTKDTSLQSLVSTIEAVLAGRVVLPRRLKAVNPASARSDRMASMMASHLTKRERQVLELLTQGMGGAKIAATLQISHNTVRTHVQGILTKLQVHSRLEAAAFAAEHGVVEAEGSRWGP